MPERILTDEQALALSGQTVGPGVVMQTNQEQGPYGTYRLENRLALAALAPSAMEVFLEVAALTIGHRGGVWCAAGVLATVAPVSGQLVDDDDTSYVYLDKDGVLQVDLVEFPAITSAAPILPLAIVTAADGDVTVIADQRAAGLLSLCGEVGPVSLTASIKPLFPNVVLVTPTGDGTAAELPNASITEAGTMTLEDKTIVDSLATNIPQPTVFFNDTGVEIPACRYINGGPGIDAGTGAIKGFLGDAASPPLSSSIIGLTTVATPDQTLGVAYDRASLPCDATGLTAGVPLYLSETTPGAGTTTRPKHPNTIVILGTIQVTGVSGSVLARVQRFSRQELSRDYGFTSSGVASGRQWVAGFYDWATTSVALTQANLTQVHGTAGQTKAAHSGVVPSGPGVVDTGQVGLRVIGTQDSETGPQVASQTGIITEDITTLTANVRAETAEKFSGEYTLELYVVNGSPVNYSLTCNYGYSKYEDFHNTDFTFDGIEVTWQGNATDNLFNIEVLHEKAAGWTYAATGFEPGNGVIAARLTDQQIESYVVNNSNGAWKHNGLAAFVNGSADEGIILRLFTGANSTIQFQNLNMRVFSEELT